MGLQERHHDVAAYALGALEPADASRCEEHLSRCVPCAAQLADFGAATRALAQLAGNTPLEPWSAPDASAAGGRRAARRGGRRRGRARPPARRLRTHLVAAAAALAVAVPGGFLLLGDDDPAMRRVSATDAATGVAAAVALRDREWGTEVALRVAGVSAPRVCELVVVGADGAERAVLNWAVPDGDEPVVETSTALRLGDIERLEVRATDGERLVSVRP
ncbi:hypothetical protein [Streptomyces sp. SP18CS02]|uniref:hypothetical protein n=1 Tax=Streptomyces sp. SP18CS02 TaxID=3002531 RepID=UPI002E761037|nr:hypothetical protein [Streptomyces sp. SP18CS02]MEE1754509.1 hypothetical protein [Streptomyces sp. SP18CS02]